MLIPNIQGKMAFSGPEMACWQRVHRIIASSEGGALAHSVGAGLTQASSDHAAGCKAANSRRAAAEPADMDKEGMLTQAKREHGTPGLYLIHCHHGVRGSQPALAACSLSLWRAMTL